ncbi:hypothetical protein C1646_759040 [Rhizophagus diaphanus]|nr:hypothetical protein C1646_759040 [Rhizophagus diaphanus] [Rhizophagus sp. MUCL 43196]
MTLVSTVIEGYSVHVTTNLSAMCKIWVTDSDGNYVTGHTKYHNCDSGSVTFNTVLSNTYWLNARVEGSLSKNKHRGPFNSDICYIINGFVDNWHLDPWEYGCDS